MKVNELMVGDWVKVEQTTETVKARVLGVHKDGVINYEVYYSGVRATDQIHTDYVSPIPLTSDILEKNWFGQKDIFTYVSGQVEIIQHRDNWNVVINKYCVFVDMNIKFVHQLQHLLLLCDIEKEIEL